MTDPSDFPALDRLTRDTAAAMREAERRPRRSRGLRRTTLLTVLGLVAVVPTAVAVRLATRTEIEFPTAGAPPERGFVVGRGQDAGLFWTLAVTRCELQGVVTLVPATLIEARPGAGGGGFSRCPRGLSGNPPRPQPLLAPTYQSAPLRLSIHWGIVPARVASVELRIHGRRVRVSTRPLAAAGVTAGKLPSAYRLFVVARAGDAIYTRAIARSASGEVLRDCTRRQCDSLARRGK